MVFLASLEGQVLLGRRVPAVGMGTMARMACLGVMASPASTENLECLVDQGSVVNLDVQALGERLAGLDLLVKLERMESLVKMEFPEPMVNRDQMAKMASQA
jgi:hypothetical protein